MIEKDKYRAMKFRLDSLNMDSNGILIIDSEAVEQKISELLKKVNVNNRLNKGNILNKYLRRNWSQDENNESINSGKNFQSSEYTT